MTVHSGRVVETVNEPIRPAFNIILYTEEDSAYQPFVEMRPGRIMKGGFKFTLRLGLANSALIIPTGDLLNSLKTAGDRLTTVHFDPDRIEQLFYMRSKEPEVGFRLR